MGKKIRACLCVLLLCTAVALIPRYSTILTDVSKLSAADALVIDAGHGGMDGGAQSKQGMTEKNINLAIALKIKDLAEKDGWRVIMTRKDDRLLGKGEGSIRNQKTQDLKARKEIIDGENALASVSIHLNSFRQDSSVRGAQVFFPSGPGDEDVLEACRMLAETVQSHLVLGLADGTDREALVKRDALIFKNPKSPVVIVECGFLSNESEAALLAQEEYQEKLAALIYQGIMEFTGKKTAESLGIIDSRGVQNTLK